VEVRSGDAETRRLIARINHRDSAAALDAERSLVATLGGGCQMPIGGIAVPVAPDGLELHAVVASLDGSRVIRYKNVGDRTNAAGLGREAAEQLLRQGAGDILKDSLIQNAEPRELT
jgi:hydroxymethylbilane synthase